MKFTTNLSDYPYREKQIARWVLGFLVFLTAGFLLYSYHQAQNNQIEVNRYQAGIDRLRLETEKEKGTVRNFPGLKKPDPKVLLANEIILKKSFSWTGFLNDLEKSTPNNISFKKIEPHFNDYSVNLSGEALTLKDLTNLILSLESKPQFSNVFLLDQKQTKDNRTDFLIHLNYKEYKEKEKHDQFPASPHL